MGRAALTLVAALAVSGCYRTTIRSGLPPGPVAPHFEDRWHSGWLLGYVESGSPSEIGAATCPDGWAEVDTRGNFVTGLVTLMTFAVYAPHQITVVCAAAPLGPPPTEGYAPPPRPGTTRPPTVGAPPGPPEVVLP